MASILKVDELQGITSAGDITVTSEGGAATQSLQQGLAKVNWNGTGTVAIRSALNVSSITDNAVGDYTANFTTAMTDANYTVTLAHQFSTTNNDSGITPQVNSGSTSMTTTAVRVSMVYTGTKYDCVVGSVNLHGDLA
jgi:hypothetical protein